MRCGQMKHRVAKETGLCLSCSRVLAHPTAVCTRCSRTSLIYNREEQLCQACEKKRRKHIRDQDKQTKVTCTVCGQLRSSTLLGQAICNACWRQKQNGRGICAGCKRLKAFQLKAERLCKQCYMDQLAPQGLRRYVADFLTPYPYNVALFDLLASTIDWESVNDKVAQKFRAFGHFLQAQQFCEPLTWEQIDAALPPLGPANRTRPKQIRACLLDLGHLLTARGKLESREAYIARRNALLPIKQASERMQAFLHRYSTWLWERQTAPSNVRDHLETLVSFWSWCEKRGIQSPEEVQASLVNDYLLSLYWQWQCSTCQGTMAFDPCERKAPGMCVHCSAIGALTKEKRYAQNTVRGQRANCSCSLTGSRSTAWCSSTRFSARLQAQSDDPTLSTRGDQPALCIHRGIRCRAGRGPDLVSHHFSRPFCVGIAACSAPHSLPLA